MKISEIVNIPSREEYLEKYFPIFSKATYSKTEFYELGKNLDYSFVSDKFNSEYYALFEGKDIVAILVIDHVRMNKPQIEYIQTSSKYRGQGLLRYLLNMALKNHDIIYGDTYETPETKHFWKMMIKYPQPEYGIYVYNIENNSYISTLNYRADMDNDIWNDYENPIIAVLKKKRFATNENKEIYLTHQEKRKNFSRDDFNIWYGDYLKHHGYENP